jgi:hypothetical protein
MYGATGPYDDWASSAINGTSHFVQASPYNGWTSSAINGTPSYNHQNYNSDNRKQNYNSDNRSQ